MKRSTRGCGCAIAVLVLLGLAVGGVIWKFDLIKWWRTRPPKPTGELQVHVLDVGPIEGDSILIISPTGKSVLIDAGDAGKGKVILDALKRYNIGKLDYFIATHPHPDHIGGASDLLKAIKVQTVLDSGIPPPDFEASTAPQQNAKGKPKSQSAKPPAKPRAGKTQLPTTKTYTEFLDAVKQNGAQLVHVAPGQRYELGDGVVLTVLAPISPPFTKDQMRGGGNVPNANSVVLRLDYGHFSMLLPGDAEAQTEQRLLSANANVAARILKIAHHGSKYATSAEFLRQVKPEAAIISVSEYNPYGQPAQVVLDRFKAAGVKLYRTDLQGEITITSKGEDYEIKTMKETKGDVYAGRAGTKDDSTRSGFIAYGDFGPPPRQPKKTTGGK